VTKYRPDQKERMIALARALYTETTMTIVKIGVEVGINKDYIHKWAREGGWVRPPKQPAEPMPNITPRQYRARFMAKEFGVQPPAIVARDVATPQGRPRKNAVKDDFKMTLKAAMEDRSAKHWAQLEADQTLIRKLWDEGLDLKQIATRVRCRVSRVRYVLKKAGANMKAPRRVSVPGGSMFAGGMSRKAKAGDWQRRT
jgi:hypothetical protein